jgi:hypothetical protein
MNLFDNNYHFFIKKFYFLKLFIKIILLIIYCKNLIFSTIKLINLDK